VHAAFAPRAAAVYYAIASALFACACVELQPPPPPPCVRGFCTTRGSGLLRNPLHTPPITAGHMGASVELFPWSSHKGPQGGTV
jgi:hypothetical protein